MANKANAGTNPEGLRWVASWGQILDHCRVKCCSYVTGRKVTWPLRDFATFATSHSLNFRSTHASTFYYAVFSQSETTTNKRSSLMWLSIHDQLIGPPSIFLLIFSCSSHLNKDCVLILDLIIHWKIMNM